ncbi:MAG: hypothetical protein JRD88_08025 [Deltaproteobacteria bacterium]|jgi:hypothetical protein|nr:hypothetical protein [Deltaproteobacteria bacterium]
MLNKRNNPGGSNFLSSSVSSTQSIRLLALYLSLIFFAVMMTACITNQINPSGRSENVSLKAEDLQKHGMSLITPTTASGKEEDKQAVALVFAGMLRENHPEIPLMTLTETLGRINSNGLEERYQKMYRDYYDTGIFDRETLSEIGTITGTRYISQLKLAAFNQQSNSRLSFLGLRLVKTQESSIRMFMTIWDSADGTIAWEGMQELSYAYDTITEKPVSFRQAVEEASVEIIRRLPGDTGTTDALLDHSRQ